MTQGNPLQRAERRKLSLLRTLAHLNSLRILPRMAELVRIDDGREDVPQNTILSRRRYIRALITRGFIEWTDDPARHPVRLTITPEGESALKEYAERNKGRE